MNAAAAGDPSLWRAIDPAHPAPPLDEELRGWDIQKARRSHLNARRLHGGQTFFLKWFFHGRLLNPGRQEWRNARRLRALAIPTVLPVGWGRHRRGTFVVLEGSSGYPADAWRRHPVNLGRLERLAAELGSLVARLHDAGLCHRDLNVYHVLVSEDGLRLIDVGRVARFLRRRWIIKDLASLLASARREGLPARLARRFLDSYLEQSRRSWRRSRLIRAVAAKAERIRRHLDRRQR